MEDAVRCVLTTWGLFSVPVSLDMNFLPIILNCDGKQYSSVYVTLYINEWVKTSYLIFFSATQITNLWYGRLQSSLHIV